MSEPIPTIPADRIVVIMPNWLGDGVMATPFLRALRNLYPAAHIAAVARPLVAPVLTGLPFINDIRIINKGDESRTSAWMRSERFDLGILLPNSFRSAWTLFLGRVKHRLGYRREWRGFFLTHPLDPLKRTPEQRLANFQKATAISTIGQQIGNHATAKVGSNYQPISTIDYYLKLAEYLGAPSPSRQMELAVTDAEREEADRILAALGLLQHTQDSGLKTQDFVVLVPGANFGSSKCWLPERFAQVADRLMDRPDRGGSFGAHVILAGSPSERPIIDAIQAASLLCPNGGGIGRLHSLPQLNAGKGISLNALKEIVRRSRLMLCNDTGPRHFAAAFNIPTVTLFGPTDPVWAETFSKNERLVRANVPCSPCQLKQCPIDHRCMTQLTTDMVLAAIEELWQ